MSLTSLSLNEFKAQYPTAYKILIEDEVPDRKGYEYFKQVGMKLKAKNV